MPRVSWLGRACALSLLALAAGAGPGWAQDAGARPGDDFDAFANGDWYRTTALPAGASNYGTTAQLRERAAADVREILAAATAAPGSALERRVGDFHASWMDVDGIEARGLAPLAEDLAAIAAIDDRRALSAWLGREMRTDDGSNSGAAGVLGVWIHQGFRDGTRHVVHLLQAGLTLGDPALYVGEDPAGREALRTRVAATLAAAGLDGAEMRADRVLAFEIALARVQIAAGEPTDAASTDNPWSRAELIAAAPGMDWPAWLEAAGLQDQDAFNPWRPGGVAGVAALVRDQPLAAWRDYLVWQHLRRHAAVLPRAVREAVGGPAASADREQVAMDGVNAALGQDVGQLYVARRFPPETRAAARAMTDHILAAWRERLTRVGWMSPATRAMALAKMDTLVVGVGHADVWVDHSALVVRRDDAYGNARRAEAAAWRRERARLDRPVDPAEWESLPPQRPGVIIHFSPNTIQFSAAILQPPHFDAAGDAASNYGSAGAGMAHEIGHTFDELGSLYDAEGRLARWWTDEDLARFRAASAPMAAQLAAYCLRPDLCVDAALVLRETNADLVGLQVAWDAYQRALGGRPDVVIDGLTGEQRFFLAFARRWRRLQDEAGLRQQFATDNHAPGPYRAATVRNLEAWARAFSIPVDAPLYLAPEERVRVW